MEPRKAIEGCPGRTNGRVTARVRKFEVGENRMLNGGRGTAEETPLSYGRAGPEELQ